MVLIALLALVRRNVVWRSVTPHPGIIAALTGATAALGVFFGWSPIAPGRR